MLFQTFSLRCNLQIDIHHGSGAGHQSYELLKAIFSYNYGWWKNNVQIELFNESDRVYFDIFS